MATIKTILHITPFFHPNIGGVETHLSDLINATKNNYKLIICTYSPLTTNVSYKKYEKYKNLEIHRFPWIGFGLFHKLEKYPILNFFYLTPYLLLRSYFVIKNKKIDTIHSHGINAAMIGIILKKIFHLKNHLTSIYSTYDNVPINNFGSKLIVSVLNATDTVLTQSLQSIKQLKKLGVQANKLDIYRHWINLNQFKPNPKIKISKFTVLFVGRLIPQKGAVLLAKIATKLSKINFIFLGNGPDYPKLEKYSKTYSNIKLISSVPYQQLHLYYQQANVLIVPSLYKEGWGRVIMEALACGLPIIASNRGAITELIDDSVAIITSPNFKNLKKSILKLSQNKKLFQKLKLNTTKYAHKNFSVKSVNLISKYY